MFGLDFGEWQGLYYFVAIIIAFFGGIIMFYDATTRFNGVFAFSLVLVHIGSFVSLRFPLVVVLYFLYFLLSEHIVNREVPEDKLPRFGLRITTNNPVQEARKLKLPSVRPHKDKDDDVSYADKVPEIEKMLADGDIVGATKYAEAELKTAEASGDNERAQKLRRYVLRLQRGKY